MATKKAPRRFDLDSSLSRPHDATFASESVARKIASDIEADPFTVRSSVSVTEIKKSDGFRAWLVRWKSNKK